VAGVALVGHHLNRLAPVFKRIDSALPVKNGVANSDILRSYLGLLVQGKSDFDAVENFRGDASFKQALGIRLLPSSPTLRQRMDARAVELFDFLLTLIETLLDIYINPKQVRHYNLHTGDMVEGEVRTPKNGEHYFALTKLDAVNGGPPEQNKHKVMFENLTPLFRKRPSDVAIDFIKGSP
jgi:hypothetical protein